MPSEAGYAELRRLFDYLRTEGVIGEDGASKWLAKPAGTDGNGDEEGKDRERKVKRVKITVVDADELLAKPKKVVKRFCEDVGLKFDEAMLQWGNEQDGEEAEEQQHKAEEAFAKWEGFHDDALKSTGLKARAEVVSLFRDSVTILKMALTKIENSHPGRGGRRMAAKVWRKGAAYHQGVCGR